MLTATISSITFNINLAKLGIPQDETETYLIVMGGEDSEQEDKVYKVDFEKKKKIADNWTFAGVESGEIENSWLYRHLTKLGANKGKVIKLCTKIDKIIYDKKKDISF